MIRFINVVVRAVNTALRVIALFSGKPKRRK